MSVSIPHKLSWRQITTHICEWHHVQYFPLVANLIPAMFEQATATSGTTPVIDGIIGAPARAGAHHAGRAHLWQVLTLQFGPSLLVFSMSQSEHNGKIARQCTLIIEVFMRCHMHLRRSGWHLCCLRRRLVANVVANHFRVVFIALCHHDPILCGRCSPGVLVI